MTHYTVKQFNGAIPEQASYSKQSGTRTFSASLFISMQKSCDSCAPFVACRVRWPHQWLRPLHQEPRLHPWRHPNKEQHRTSIMCSTDLLTTSRLVTATPRLVAVTACATARQSQHSRR